MHPPDYLLDVKMASTMESFDKFAAGIMLMDWLYYRAGRGITTCCMA
jgi:hypothetical protein